ncbi:MAG: hypothetical protein ACLFWF_03560 [Alphaproteobacteria bacterium]
MSKASKSEPERLPTERELELIQSRLNLPDQVIGYLRQRPRPEDDVHNGKFVFVVFLALFLCFLPLIIRSSVLGRFLVGIDMLSADTMLVNLHLPSIYLAAAAGAPLSVFLFDRVLRRFPDFYTKSIVAELYSMARPEQAKEGWVSRIKNRFSASGFLKGVNRGLPPEAYLRSYKQRMAGMYGVGASVVYLAALSLFMHDLASAGRVTPEGIRISPYFSSRALNYSWHDAISIRITCYTVGGVRSRNHTFQYGVRFRDGRTVNVGEYEAAGRNFVDALEFVDGKLAALGVDKSRGRAQKGCLKSIRRELGARDFKRLVRLL